MALRFECSPSRPRASATALALTFAAGLASASPVSAAPVPVGAVDKAQGSVEATQSGVSRSLAIEAPVLFGDRLKTGPAARLEAKLADGTVLTLGEKGRLTVDRFVYDPDRNGGTLALTVKSGTFLFVGGKVEGSTGGNVAINTPVGPLGVRGTTVWGGHIDGGFGVLVLSGEVVLKTRHGDVVMQKGQGTMVYGDKGPRSAAPWPEDRVKRAVATISFASAAGGSAGSIPPADEEPILRVLRDLLPTAP